MPAALDEPERDALAGRDVDDEPAPVDRRRPDLEMRVARSRERARAEQRPAEVRAAAARPERRDLRQLVAQVLRKRHLQPHALEREQSPLVLDAEVAVRADAVRGDDPVSGDERRQRAAPAEGAGRTRGTGIARERRELAVGDDVAARDLAQRAGTLAVEAVRQP